MKIIHRLQKYIDYKEVSLNSFDKSIGAANGYIGKQIKNEASIGSDLLEKIISTYSDLNLNWLITGEGLMLKGPEQKEEPVANFASTHGEGIPLVSMEVAAGFGNWDFAITDQNIEARYVVPDFNGIDFMIRVKGSSMYPKYSSGDIIACRKLNDSKFIQWNKCHVIATREQGLLVKRLKKGSVEKNILAISDNKEYDPFEIPMDEVTGIALVIGVIRLE